MDRTTAGPRLASINRTFSRLVSMSGSRSAFARQAEAAGVSLTQASYMLLRNTLEGELLTMGELARLAQMDLGMATRQINRLVADGHVIRQVDPSDRRVVRVAATSTGISLARALQGVRMSPLALSLADWSEHDSRAFDTLLTRFQADTETTSFRFP